MCKLDKVHNCEKGKGKIVCITIDKIGITRCAYCNQVVNYTNYFKYQEAKRIIKQVNNHYLTP